MSDRPSNDATIAMDALPTSLAPGAMFAGRYRIERAIGAGGMGAVYAARDTTLDEPVALKVLRPPRELSADLLDRFRREVRLARRVTHRNVARTYDIGQLGELHYLTMELVVGESLESYLAACGRLPADEAIAIAVQLCEGLAAAHAAGVVHRDLKPANILREASGRVVITDFGIARGILDDRDRTIGEGQLIGTPAYMAPEQVEGGAVTGATDLYALGLIVFELLTGRQAFGGDSAIAVALARVSSAAPTPADLAAVDPALAEVVCRCLARSPADRPADADALRAALVQLEPLAGDAGPMGSGATLSMPPVGAATTKPTPSPGSFVTLDPGQTAVAVLPFRYRGPPDDAYLAEVLTDELVDLLSMTRGLRVPSAGATARFGDDRDPRVVGEALDVDAIIDGSLQRMGPRVRVTARLVHTRTGTQTFSEQIDGTLDDLWQLQDRIAKRVAEALRLRLQAPAFSTISPAAAEAYLRARQRSKDYVLGGEGPDGAIALYEACLAEAPEFGPAVAGHALACARMWFFFGGSDKSDRDWPAECARAVERALRFAPQLPESHLAAARMHVQRAEYPAAAQALQAALVRSPTCGSAHAYLGLLQCEAGRPDEGVRHIRLGVELDPAEEPTLMAVARTYALRGDYAAADALFDRIAASAAGIARPVGFARIRTAAWAGDLDRVRALRGDAPSATDAGHWGWLLASAYLGEADLPAIETAFAREVGGSGSPRYQSLMRQLTTEAFGAAGLVDAALAQLRLATDHALVDIDWLDHCPVLASLRGTEAFAVCRAAVQARAEAIWQLE